MLHRRCRIDGQEIDHDRQDKLALAAARPQAGPGRAREFADAAEIF
jgi:hypothetical protein